MKQVQRIFAHNQLWVVVSSVATLGGLIVAIVALFLDDGKNSEPGDLPPGLTAPLLELSLRGDTRFHLLLEEGQRFMEQGNVDHAFNSFDAAVKRIPVDKPGARDEALAYLLRGEADLNRREYNYALTDFFEAHERGTPETKPISAEYIGLAFLGLEDYERAEEYLLSALRTYNRASPGVYGGLAFIDYYFGDFARCDDNFSLAIDAAYREPRRIPGLLYGRALCAEAAGELDLALADIDEAIRIGGPMTDFLLDYERKLLRECGGQPPC